MRKLILLLSLLIPSLAESQIARVNNACAEDFTGASPTSSLAVSGGTSLSQGSLIVISVTFEDTGNSISISSITDTASNNYAQINTARAGVTNQYLWYAFNTTANGSNIVTVHTSANVGYWSACSSQYSGLAIASVLDASATGVQAFGTSVVSGTFSTDTADEIVVAAVRSQNAPSMSGYTPDAASTRNDTFSLIETATQSGITATATFTIDEATILVATFRAAAGGGGPTFPFGILNNPIRGGGKSARPSKRYY